MAKQTKTRSAWKRKDVKIATWNLQGGLQSNQAFETVAQDMTKYKIDIACLQETRCEEYNYFPKNNNGYITCIGSDSNTPVHRRYGQGFYISPQWIDNYLGVTKISDRISVLQMTLNNNSERKPIMTIVNIYAPTSQFAQKYPDEYKTFYKNIQEVIIKYKSKSSIFIIAGDFNSKCGIRQSEEETFMGNYGKGSRNQNGERMVELIMDNDLYLSNTKFKHSMRHRSTWHGITRDKVYHNQIDYIATQKSMERLITNARSHRGHTFDSDHSMVITTFNFQHYHRRVNKKREYTRKLDLQELSNNCELQMEYQTHINKELKNRKQTEDINEEYDNICSIIKKSAEFTLPKNNTNYNDLIQYNNEPEILEYMKKRKQIRKTIESKKNNNKRSNLHNLVRKKNKLNKKIRARVKFLQHLKIEKLAIELEKHNGNRKCYEIQRILKKKDPNQGLRINTDDNQIQMNPAQILPNVTTWYSKFYTQDGFDKITPWDGEPRPLQIPIDMNEVTTAVGRLNNNRASGKDNIAAELIKYGGNELALCISNIYNNIFYNHVSLTALLEGILIPINKPGKALKIENTRPITLLNTIRKILSILVLNRIQPYITQFIGEGQSGFLPGRSTTDIIWTYRYYMAYVDKMKEKFHIIGIDMSKAFDCINRQILLANIKNIIPESEFRIIKYLLSDTTLTPRVKGQYGTTFSTIIGTPQGDALSPILFIIYLECALKKANHKQYVEMSNILFQQPTYYKEIAYADDIDFISNSEMQIDIIENTIPKVLQEYNLVVNTNKTEHIEINSSNIKNINNKKLGSRISSNKDITYRINQANNIFHKMWKIWLQHKNIKLPTRMKLYNAITKSTLLYNTAALGPTVKEMERMNITHRKHLRHICRIYYPNTISNKKLYKITQSEPITIQIMKARWKYIYKILRQNRQSPAIEIMKIYYESKRTCTGASQATLPKLLDDDMKLIGKRLQNLADLEYLQQLAKKPSKSEWNRNIESAILEQYNKKRINIKKNTKNKKQTTYNSVVIQQGNETTSKKRKITLTFRKRKQKRKRLILTFKSMGYQEKLKEIRNSRKRYENIIDTTSKKDY